MKRKEIESLRSQSVAELEKSAIELSKKVAELSVNRYTKPSKNTRERKMIRQHVATIRTILAERALEVEG